MVKRQHGTLLWWSSSGQGSTNSPVIWVRRSHHPSARSKLVGPDGSYHLKVFMIGFVDDSNACVHDVTNPTQSPYLLLERATADAQLWNDLLSSSGGALEIPKSVYHLTHYGFTEAGCPVPQPSPPSFCFITTWMQNPPISCTSPSSSQASHTPSLPTPFQKGLSPPYKTHLSAPSFPEWGSPGIPPMPSCMAPSPSEELTFDRSTTSKDSPRWN
jgi:hypothetical protein